MGLPEAYFLSASGTLGSTGSWDWRMKVLANSTVMDIRWSLTLCLLKPWRLAWPKLMTDLTDGQLN